MTTTGTKLSPQLLDAMRENDYNLENHQYKTFYDDQGIESPNDRINKQLQALEVELSDPLKKIHSVWLTKTAKSCYPEKHISDDFTNMEQIKFCREKAKDNLLGNFYQAVHDRRTKDAYDLKN